MSTSAAVVLDQVTKGILAEMPQLRRRAMRLTRRTADADDLVQETFLRAYSARARFEPGTRLEAWLHTILKRVFLMNVLKAKRRATPTETDCGVALHGVAATAPPSPTPLSYAQVLDRLDDRVRRAVILLPEKQRTVLLLWALEGLSCREIAGRLAIPPGTVMSRIFRARRRILSQIDGE